jgi:hypothetical protein
VGSGKVPLEGERVGARGKGREECERDRERRKTGKKGDVYRRRKVEREGRTRTGGIKWNGMETVI